MTCRPVPFLVTKAQLPDGPIPADYECPVCGQDVRVDEATLYDGVCTVTLAPHDMPTSMTDALLNAGSIAAAVGLVVLSYAALVLLALG